MQYLKNELDKSQLLFYNNNKLLLRGEMLKSFAQSLIRVKLFLEMRENVHAMTTEWLEVLPPSWRHLLPVKIQHFRHSSASYSAFEPKLGLFVQDIKIALLLQFEIYLAFWKD